MKLEDFYLAVDEFAASYVVKRMNPSMMRGLVNVVSRLNLVRKLFDMPTPLGTVLDVIVLFEIVDAERQTIDLDKVEKAIEAYYETEEEFHLGGLHFAKADGQALIQHLKAMR